jgi:rod shape-determining protein MreD
VIVFAVLAQTIFGNDLRVDDVAPDFMMLLAVCAGFVGGPDRGATAGFVSGLVADLFLPSTPFGLSALVCCLVGFVVGSARDNFLRPRLLLLPVVAAAGTVLGVALFVAIGYIVGQQQLVAPGETWLAGVAAIEACYSVVFALPAAALMGWALSGPTTAPESLNDAMAAGLTDLAGRLHPRSSRRRRARRARARRITVR